MEPFSHLNIETHWTEYWWLGMRKMQKKIIISLSSSTSTLLQLIISLNFLILRLPHPKPASQWKNFHPSCITKFFMWQKKKKYYWDIGKVLCMYNREQCKIILQQHRKWWNWQEEVKIILSIAELKLWIFNDCSELLRTWDYKVFFLSSFNSRYLDPTDLNIPNI